MHFILDPFRRDAALFEMFYSLSGLRYSGRHDAKPLLFRAALCNAVDTLLNTAPLPSEATLSRCYARQSYAQPLLRHAWQRRAAPDRCYAAQGYAVATPLRASPLLCLARPRFSPRFRCSSPQIVSKRHRTFALLFPSFYSLSGLRYSGRCGAEPLLRKAGHSRCSARLCFALPLLCSAHLSGA
jgi:hypothetical protein